MIDRLWQIKEQDESEILQLSAQLNLPLAVVRVLVNRNLTTKEQIQDFLEPSGINLEDTVFFGDMKKAVDIINDAIAKDEYIAIYGDYDVDGVSSVSLLYLYLTKRSVRVTYYIPDRSDEGYGINPSALDKLKAEGVTLIITVDTGITAIEEVEYATSIGLKMIITDHHECKETLPAALAVINPKATDELSFKEFAGVGVAFKLLCALEGNCSATLGEYCDIVAIGTIADVMPLINENRIIVKAGLKKLNSSQIGRASCRERV